MKSPRRRTLAAPAGYDLLTAISDPTEPGGYFVHAVPVVAFEIESTESHADRVVQAVALDGDTCSTSDKAVRAPDGRITAMDCNTHPDIDAWLESLREAKEPELV